MSVALPEKFTRRGTEAQPVNEDVCCAFIDQQNNSNTKSHERMCLPEFMTRSSSSVSF